MLIRLDKLGMLPKDVKVFSPEKDNIDNSVTLEKFLYKPTNGKTIRGFYELGENTDWYYESNHSRYAYLRSDKSEERYNTIDSGRNQTSINNLQELTFPQVIAAWDNGYGHKSGQELLVLLKQSYFLLFLTKEKSSGILIFKTVSLMQTFKRKHLMPYKIGSYIMTKCSGD